MNLINLADDRIERFGETLSVVFEGQEYSTTRIYELGQKLAGGLKSLGIGRGDHVVVSLSNSPEVYACFQGSCFLTTISIKMLGAHGKLRNGKKQK